MGSKAVDPGAILWYYIYDTQTGRHRSVMRITIEQVKANESIKSYIKNVLSQYITAVLLKMDIMH